MRKITFWDSLKKTLTYNVQKNVSDKKKHMSKTNFTFFIY